MTHIALHTRMLYNYIHTHACAPFFSEVIKENSCRRRKKKKNNIDAYLLAVRNTIAHVNLSAKYTRHDCAQHILFALRRYEFQRLARQIVPTAKVTTEIRHGSKTSAYRFSENKKK